MISMIKWQLQLAIKRKELFFSFAVFFALSAASFVAYCMECAFQSHEVINTYSASTVFVLHVSYMPYAFLFLFLIPLVAPMAFSDSYFMERKQGVRFAILSRVDGDRYLCAKGIACFMLSFLVVLIPLIINQGLALIAFPLNSPRNYANNASYAFGYEYFLNNMQFVNVYLARPYAYNFIFALLAATYAGFCGFIASMMSFRVARHRIAVLIGMFIVTGISISIGAVINTMEWCKSSLMIVSYFTAADDSLPKFPIVWPFAILVLVSAGMYIANRRSMRAGDLL